MAVVRDREGRVLLDRVQVSGSFERKNARGLLGRDGLEPGEGLLLSDPLGMIHMFFMRFAIDAVFLDRDLVVKKVAAELKPWRISRASGATKILEIGAGEAARLGIRPGDRLELVEDGRADG